MYIFLFEYRINLKKENVIFIISAHIILMIIVTSVQIICLKFCIGKELIFVLIFDAYTHIYLLYLFLIEVLILLKYRFMHALFIKYIISNL